MRMAIAVFASISIISINGSSTTSGAGFGFSTGVVKLHTEQNKKKVTLVYSLKNGYGIQKDGPHEISIYKISKKKFSSKSGAKGIVQDGKLVKKLKPVKFSGWTAKADKDYFSKVKPVYISVRAKKSEVYAVTSKIYYCSFSDKFCSVEVIEKILK